jgi:hypothetical protein
MSWKWLVTLIAVVSPFAGAADWKHVGKTVDNTEYSIDRDSIKLLSRDEEIVEVWQKTSSPLMRVSLSINNHRRRVEHDCIRHTAEVVESCTYFNEYKVGCSEPGWRMPSFPMDLRPGSIGYQVHQMVCSLGSQHR